MKYIILLLLLVGCSNSPQKVVLEPAVKIEKPPFVHPHPPSPLNLQIPKFHILTKDNALIYFETNDEVIFGVTSDGYAILSTNTQELRRYILELQNLIRFYKKAVDSSD